MSYKVDYPFGGLEEYEKERNRLLKKHDTYERRKGHFDVVGWLLRQHEYAKCAERGRPAIKLKAGEIYEVDFGINVDSEFSYRHYALVMADSFENNPLVLVCPLKTNTRGPHPKSDVNLGIIECLDEERESLAVINQIRTIDKLRIFRKNAIYKGKEIRHRLLDTNQDEYDYNDEEENIGYRLEDDKFKIVQDAVLNYIMYGKVTR